jgi:hypothetical protein
MMQLITPTPMNALRQPRSASLSSERLTPGAAAIDLISSNIRAADVDRGFGGKRQEIYQ